MGILKAYISAKGLMTGRTFRISMRRRKGRIWLSVWRSRENYPYIIPDRNIPATEWEITSCLPLPYCKKNGSRVVNFVYKEHRIIAGKPSISPLPATYINNEDEACTLEIDLYDELIDCGLTLSYTIFADMPVLTRNVRIHNFGCDRLTIERIMSASFDFVDADYDRLYLTGAWGRERSVKRAALETGVQSIQSNTGTCSSAEYNPFMTLCRPNADEQNGEVFGFNLVYSGNFLINTEVSTHSMTRLMLGINPNGFLWQLDASESFQTPEAIMVYSDAGLGKMSRTFHRLFRKNLMNGAWKEKERPILLNNWEATCFDFDEEKILKIAQKAKEVGIELFVLDDGWFGERNDDTAGLGDWFVNKDKLPNGIAGLAEAIEKMGMSFGLWIEPEMINMNSRLYEEHPDYLIRVPGRFASHSRHQYVLDFSRRDVVDAIYEMIAGILRESAISYIKWDMNRYMSEPYSSSLPADRQGEVMHRYILGVYDLYERLTTEFPDILFESCASGGARFDSGLMYFAPQTWTSDDTDANERTKITYGTSMLYPLVSIGSHVSAVPNQQLNRTTPIESRAAIAYFGTFGYEMDLNLISDEEIKIVERQIKFMKKYRHLIQVDGDFYRLLNPFEGNETAWQVVSQDKSESIAVYYQSLNRVNDSFVRLKLQGLDCDRLYEVKVDISDINNRKQACEEVLTYRAYGDELMYAGIPVSRQHLYNRGGDFAALVYEIQGVE